MRNNDTGEFELVVGNRQLLSGFFVVVLLFAVAFAMGYVVGQNSPKSMRASAAEQAAVALTPSDIRPQPAQSVTPTAAPETSHTPPATEPAQGQPPTASENPPPAPAPAAPEAPPGSYWQVMAVPQADAEVVVRTLKDKGFPASLSQGPNNLMRVLVGPYNDRQTMGKAKTDLENLGLRPIMR